MMSGQQNADLQNIRLETIVKNAYADIYIIDVYPTQILNFRLVVDVCQLKETT